MRLLYSNVIQQNKGWGAEWFTNNALNDIGIETETIDYRAHRFSLPLKFFFSRPADYFLLQRGDRFPLGILDNIQVPKFFWASELVSRRRDQDRLFQYGFDHVFVRGEICKKAVIEKKWVPEDRVSILLSAYDPKIFYKTNVIKDIDVLFVGSLTPRRKKILGQIPNVTIQKAYGLELQNLINRSKIILNIHAEEYVDTETRVFEVLGAGGFLLSERLGSENPFSEIVQCDISDFAEKIDFYLKNEVERERIAKLCYEKARTHTYTDRAREILTIIEKYPQVKKKISWRMVCTWPHIVWSECMYRLKKLY